MIMTIYTPLDLLRGLDGDSVHDSQPLEIAFCQPQLLFSVTFLLFRCLILSLYISVPFSCRAIIERSLFRQWLHRRKDTVIQGL